jgi:hypothetical protein
MNDSAVHDFTNAACGALFTRGRQPATPDSLRYPRRDRVFALRGCPRRFQFLHWLRCKLDVNAQESLKATYESFVEFLWVRRQTRRAKEQDIALDAL